MRTERESPTSGYDADRASRGLNTEGTDMTNSTEPVDFEQLRAKRAAAIIAGAPNDDRCPCGAVVEDGNPWCSYEHYLEYDLAVEAEELRAERDRLADEVDRLQRRNEDLKAGLLAAEADKNRLRESLRGKQFILWGELALFEAKAQARLGRRLESKMHDDQRVCETWDAFRDALDEAIRADIAAEAGESR
jgi:hypothetical protein